MNKILIVLSVLGWTYLARARQSGSSPSFPVCEEREGRRKVCKNVTECKTVCQKKECKTTYQYRKDWTRVTHLSLSDPSSIVKMLTV